MSRKNVFVYIALILSMTFKSRVAPEIKPVGGISIADFNPAVYGEVKWERHGCRIYRNSVKTLVCHIILNIAVAQM